MITPTMLKVGAIVLGSLSGVSLVAGSISATNEIHRQESDGRILTKGEKAKIYIPRLIPGVVFFIGAGGCIYKASEIDKESIKQLSSSLNAGSAFVNTTRDVTKAIVGPQKAKEVLETSVANKVQPVASTVNMTVNSEAGECLCGLVWDNQTDEQQVRTYYVNSPQEHEKMYLRTLAAFGKKHAECPENYEGLSLRDLINNTSGNSRPEDDRWVWPARKLPSDYRPIPIFTDKGLPCYALWIPTNPERR